MTLRAMGDMMALMDVPAESPFEMAERHIREGEEHVAKQKALIVELERDGHDNMLPAARELLALFEQTLATHREHAAVERRTVN